MSNSGWLTNSDVLFSEDEIERLRKHRQSAIDNWREAKERIAELEAREQGPTNQPTDEVVALRKRLADANDEIRELRGGGLLDQAERIAELRALLDRILKAEAEFRKTMPPTWEGDPLTDACDAARTALKEQSDDGR